MAAILSMFSAVFVSQALASDKGSSLDVDFENCTTDCRNGFWNCMHSGSDPWPCKQANEQCMEACRTRRYGTWGSPSEWPNVAIHAHVLPSGKVMFWSRREWSGAKPTEGLDPRECTPRLWDPTSNIFAELARPGYNLFCSGHTFLPDGRLLVTGGHVSDGVGEKHAAIYDADRNTWTKLDDMNAGRWYPNAITLPTGGVFVFGGAVTPAEGNNSVPQIWERGKWRSLAQFPPPGDTPLYPMMHVAPDGRVFVAGPIKHTWFLNTNGAGSWTEGPASAGTYRDFGSSVIYDKGKVIIIGGGNPPQNTAETIDLNQHTPAWQFTGNMKYARRQHNATILPDGRILVTGGTSGVGFNDLSKPVKTSEIWDPETGQWTEMDSERVPRMYHSVAVLLPDGRVLSAGGGEYRPDDGHENDPKDSHRDAQIFSPPYLFQGACPEITTAPKVINYGKQFTVQISHSSEARQINLVRLSSVTHAFNQNQRIIKNLVFTSNGEGKLQVVAPDSPNVCPPGHYMFFVLNSSGVPSVAKILKIQ